ncbi:MAG: membrane protein insertase YidC [Dehalococcoidia bacterium]|nr:membrane protein insertase YidC [Dehalococcoidia bacterium]
MEAFSLIWNEGVTRPMANGLVFFYAILGSNFGLSIIFFTLVTRVLLYPLTIKQLRSTRAMMAMQPRMKELQAKYKDDKASQSREMMKLYKEAGVNPLGCLGPMIIQLPIWIGLYSALRSVLADTPEGLVSLSQKLYSWLPFVNESIPINNHFLWMDLGRPDSAPLTMMIMPILVGASMWVVQKMSTVPSTDPKQRQQTQLMNWMFPLIFGFWTLSFPSGLALYWVVSNIVSIGLQYRATGWGMLFTKAPPLEPAPAASATAKALVPSASRAALPAPQAAPPPAAQERPKRNLLARIFLGSPPAPPAPPPAAPSAAADGKGAASGTSGNDRQDSRRSRGEGPAPAGRRPRRRRGGRRRQGP